MKYSDIAYEERLAELFRKSPSVQNVGFGNGAYKAGLEGMMRLDRTLGHPHSHFRTVHVAGTNGKGSVCCMIAANLSAAGFRTGLYTSPHLLDFRERIRTAGGEMIPKEDVWEFLETYDKELEGLSFFEITTGMCFWWFEKQKVDYAVIETGLGGRLDSTNIITPQLSVVTSIGLDHCALLGSTRDRIAFEKAGIFKSGRPALVWGHDSETDSIFESEAASRGAYLHYARPLAQEQLPETDLKGICQSRNLTTVLSALELMGIPSDAGAFAHTASLTGLRGRWETLCRKPFTICDIGHNPAALELNFRALESDGRKLEIIYGVMADKDLDSIIPLMPSDAHYHLVEPHVPRAMALDTLYGRIHSARPELRLHKSESVEAAVREASSAAGDDTLIYIGGSTFVVAEALPLYPL